jgi:hypothetical protein
LPKTGTGKSISPEVSVPFFIFHSERSEEPASTPPHDADEILKKLKAFGVDVIANRYMSDMVAKTSEEQNSRFTDR